jgi:hypothetical protein
MPVLGICGLYSFMHIKGIYIACSSGMNQWEHWYLDLWDKPANLVPKGSDQNQQHTQIALQPYS